MKNGYELLTTLTSTLDSSTNIIEKISSCSKNDFSNDEEMINVSTGFVSEIGNILNCLDDELLYLSSSLRKLIIPIREYSNNMLNRYKFVNAYKLYDCVCIDICNLKECLDSLK